jgi:hypothetical protein
VARVVCEKDGVLVKDPVVRAERDGVHLTIENPGGAWGIDLHHESWAWGSGEGFKLSEGSTPDLSAMGPGRVTIACTPTARSSYYDAGVPTATLTVVDPNGLYVPWQLVCGLGDQFRLTIDAGANEDAISIARRVPGVTSTDDLQSPNYPGSPRYYPTEFIVLRDGSAVARILGPCVDGECELIVNACPGSEIVNH